MADARAREILTEVGGLIGDPSGPRAIYEALLDPRDPFELGLAVSAGASGTSVLVSYNPRMREAAPRDRMLSALAGIGIDPRAARAAFALVPRDRASVVLGVEWRAGAATTATLYLEEIARFHSPLEISAVQRELARLVSVDPDGASDPGETYIWALDLTRGAGRPSAFKVYRRTTDTRAVLATALAFGSGAIDPRLERAWTDGTEPSGWILQRRFARAAAPRLKIYKTYEYESRPTPTADAEMRALLAVIDPDPGARALLDAIEGDPTSVGVSLESGSPEPRAVTGYWRIARGKSAGQLQE